MNKAEAERYQWNWQHFQGRKFESRESKTIVQVVSMFVQENNGTYNVLCTVETEGGHKFDEKLIDINLNYFMVIEKRDISAELK